MSEGWDSRETSPTAVQRAGGHGLAGILLGLWRAKWLMMLVFLPIFAAGLAVAFRMPKEFTAQSRLYVTLGEEYVYRPRVGGVAAGAIPDSDQVIQAELEILRSPVVAERVLRRFGLRTMFPDLAQAYEAAVPAEREAVFQRGVESMSRAFTAQSAPKTPVISTSFSHDDPAIAADVLNALIGAYLAYRTEIFQQGRTDGLTAQRKRFEGELLDAEAAIQAFLDESGIGDFEAERASANGLFGSISEELLNVQARASAVEGEVSVLRSQLAATPAETNLYVEDNTPQQLQQLEIEREQLLSRYRPDSTPVREIDRKIAQMRAFMDGQGGSASGLVRRGPNPLYQELETRLATLQAESRALAEQGAELRKQLQRIDERQSRLNALAPRYQELLRQKDLFESNVRSFAEREVEEAALRELAMVEADNIRIIEPARPPTTGSSLKLPVAALSFLFAGFTALIAGLLSAFTRRGLTTPGRLTRTTGLPVLAAPRKR